MPGRNETPPPLLARFLPHAAFDTDAGRQLTLPVTRAVGGRRQFATTPSPSRTPTASQDATSFPDAFAHFPLVPAALDLEGQVVPAIIIPSPQAHDQLSLREPRARLCVSCPPVARSSRRNFCPVFDFIFTLTPSRKRLASARHTPGIMVFNLTPKQKLAATIGISFIFFVAEIVGMYAQL